MKSPLLSRRVVLVVTLIRDPALQWALTLRGGGRLADAPDSCGKHPQHFGVGLEGGAKSY